MILRPQPFEGHTPSHTINHQYARFAEVEEVRFKHQELIEDEAFVELEAQ